LIASTSSPRTPPPISPLFPYTTLFRSQKRRESVQQTLAVVCRRVLEMFDAAGILRTDPADLQIEINWPSPLPESDFDQLDLAQRDRKSTRLNSSHVANSYAVFCLKKKK